MIKNSKKSIILFELLISITIISIVIIFSLLFINNLYKNNSQNMKILNHKLDLKSTIIFIQNRLQTARKIDIKNNILSYYEIDINSFKSDYYSGLVLLENSTKDYIHTPNSIKLDKIDAKYIYFNDNNIYEIENNNKNSKIFFKNKNIEKNISEQYHLIKQISKIYVNNNILYFNNSILLKNISKFELKEENNNLKLNICTIYCQEVIIVL